MNTKFLISFWIKIFPLGSAITAVSFSRFDPFESRKLLFICDIIDLLNISNHHPDHILRFIENFLRRLKTFQQDWVSMRNHHAYLLPIPTCELNKKKWLRFYFKSKHVWYWLKKLYHPWIEIEYLRFWHIPISAWVFTKVSYTPPLSSIAVTWDKILYTSPEGCKKPLSYA